MTRCSVVLVVALLSRSALAQPAVPAGAPIAAFLEKRVPDELASEGVLLSRRNLSLQIQPVGAQLLVSLVDMTTGRVAASTKLDQVPADREAAVAAVTHLAADLVTEVVGRAPPPPPAPAPPPGLIDDRAERAEREISELRFKRQSIRFGANYDLLVTGSGNTLTATTVRQWVAYQGDSDQELAPEDFYTQLGREDLADSYRTRHGLEIGSFIVGSAAFVTGFYLSFQALSFPDNHCATSSGDFGACIEREMAESAERRSTYGVPAAVAFGVGLTGMLVGLWTHYHRHPISENEAKSLADAYNQKLRGKLGLPVATRRSGIHDVKFAPYAASGGGGGLALGGSF